MSREVELTMRELTQIALGTGPELNNVNVNVLHSLINIILKKLDCQDEKVTFVGIESQCLREVLKNSKTTQLPVIDDKVELMSTKFDQLDKLDIQVKSIEKKLEQHFEQIRLSHKAAGEELDYNAWEKYSAPDEDLCTVCEPENDIACSLMRNIGFLKKLHRRLSAPFVDRIFQFEDKIVTLQTTFEKFLDRAQEEYARIALVGRCMYETEMLRKKFESYHAEFISTMEEVQDMLDAKLDKIHLPALKRYLKERFDGIEGKISQLQSNKDCPKAAGIVMGDVRCVSCGNAKVCSDVGVHGTAVLPSMSAKPIKLRKICGCPGNCNTELKLSERMQIVEKNAILKKLKKPKASIAKVTNFGGTEIKLFMGTDGGYYRKDANRA